MEPQGPPRDAGGANPTATPGRIPSLAGSEFRAQRPSIPPTTFFQGFMGGGNQMPFLYPHSFMPLIPGLGFTAPAHAVPSATVDLTKGSQKRGPQDPSRSTPI